MAKRGRGCGNNKVAVGDLVNTIEVHENPQAAGGRRKWEFEDSRIKVKTMMAYAFLYKKLVLAVMLVFPSFQTGPFLYLKENSRGKKWFR